MKPEPGKRRAVGRALDRHIAQTFESASHGARPVDDPWMTADDLWKRSPDLVHNRPASVHNRALSVDERNRANHHILRPGSQPDHNILWFSS